MSLPAGSPRVVVAEDSALLREMLVAALTRFGFTVPGCAADPAQLLEAVAHHRPDAVLTDVRMPPGFRDEGLRAAVELRQQQPDLPILVLSQYVEHSYARRLLADDARGVGYLLKDRVADVGDFLEALRRVAGGGTALDPEVVGQLLARARRRDPLERLTARERDVLALMAEGRANSAVAAALVVSDGAVEKHIGNIFAKLGLEPAEGDHRRVLAVLRFLEAEGRTP